MPIKEPSDKETLSASPHRPWTQEELTLLHDMVAEYRNMQWLKKKAWMWGVWILGLPTAVLMVWEPLVRLWKLFRGV